MEKMISYLKERYNNTHMIITENGRHILKLEMFSVDNLFNAFLTKILSPAGFDLESYLYCTIKEYLH